MTKAPDSLILSWDPLITSLARKRCRMVGIEFEDLLQEGRVSVVTSYAMGLIPTEQSIVNALRRYMRAVREGRAVVYEPSVQSLFSLPL